MSRIVKSRRSVKRTTLSKLRPDIIFTFMVEVTQRRRGSAKISSKHQITIPTAAMRSAGLEVGDRVSARAEGSGRVVLERELDVVAEFAGALSGVYQYDELDQLRSEWE